MTCAHCLLSLDRDQKMRLSPDQFLREVKIQSISLLNSVLLNGLGIFSNLCPLTSVGTVTPFALCLSC
jgi:hypothetical protein